MGKTEENGSNQNLISAGFLLLTLAVSAVFLASRGEDIGRLPMFARGILRTKFFGANGFGESLLGLLIALLIVASWFGLGSFIVGFFEEDSESNALNFARASAFGAAAWSLVWFFAGLVGGYKSYTAIGFTIVGLALAVFYAARKIRSLKKSEDETGFSLFGKIVLGLIIFTLLLTLVSALAPPTAKDALLYHLALPKAFVAQSSNGTVEGNIASFLALGVEMQSVWAMLTGKLFNARIGEAAASATVYTFAPLLILMVYGWARSLKIDKNLSLLAVLLVAAIPTFYAVASSNYIDLALALYIALAIQATGEWWRTQATKPLVFLSIALGAALCIKLTTVFVIAALALMVLLRARNDKGNSARITGKAFAGFAVAGLIASPWYLRTWVRTGSPIFPFYMNLWNGAATGWDAERSALFQTMNSRYGGAEKSAFDYLLAPVKISLWAQPEQPAFYDGVLGVSFLLGLLLIIWAWREFDFPVELKIAVGTGGIVFLFWLFSSEQLRYLLPVLPGLAVATVASVGLMTAENSSARKVFCGALMATALIGILTSVAWVAEKNPLPVVFGGESREDFLTRRLDYYKYYKIVNRDLPPDAKVWLINMRRDTYNLDKSYFSDYLFEDWTLKKAIEESRDLNELRSKARALGITHLLVRHDVLLDYKRSPVVDERRAESENRAKLKMTEDFVLDKANVIEQDEKFSLVKLP